MPNCIGQISLHYELKFKWPLQVVEFLADLSEGKGEFLQLLRALIGSSGYQRWHSVLVLLITRSMTLGK